jgi:signal transduction histidine kinase
VKRSRGESAENLSEVLEHLNQGVTFFDHDLRLVCWNKRVAALLGFPAGLGRPGTPFEVFIRYNAERGEYGDVDPDEFVRRRVEQARQLVPHRFERTRPNGMILEVQGMPTSEGGFVTTYTDVTELRQAQRLLEDTNAALEARVRQRTEELVRREAELQTVIDNISQGITLIDRDINMVLCNDQTVRLLDLPASFGRPGTPLAVSFRYNAERGEYGPGDVEELVAERVRLAKEFKPHRFERTRLDGTVLEIIGRPVPQGFVTTYADVTVRRQAERALAEANRELEHRVAERTAALEQELVRREEVEKELSASVAKAELANRAKTEFLANMSHELRTPLNAVLGFAEMLRQETFGPLGHEKYREYAEIICSSGNHLLSLIGDVLDVAALEAGEVRLEEEAIDVKEAVASCCRMLAHRLEQKRLTIENSVEDDLPLLLADRRRLQQILINLLGNAIKFTPDGGRIRVSGAITEDGQMAIEIADSGIGIREEDLAKVLRPFWQVAGQSRMRDAEGAGLGLYLVDALMALHGGSLRLESEVARGTTARLIFAGSRIGAAPVGATMPK